MDKILLRCITLFNPILVRAGVDTYQLYLILKTKLVIDSRRPKVMFSARKNAKNNTTQSPWLTSFFTLLMGLFISLVLLLNKMPYVGQSFYFIIFMVLMSLTLISDFTTVLIDTRDQYIILPRPVGDRTVTVSRILHISTYILRLALLQGLPALVIVGFIDGPLATPLFFMQILEATFMSIFLVNIVYLVLMKFVSPQRFKDIISYIQIGFSIIIFGTYYLLPKLINVSALENISILSHWWAYLLPPVWIAALNELLIHNQRAGLITSLLAIIGLLTPLIGIWLVAKILAPGFNRRLTIIATSDGNPNVQQGVKKVKRPGLIDKIGHWVTSDPVENAGFNITRKLALRTREFKMKVYPAFGYIPIYFLFTVFNGRGQSLAERWQNVREGHSYVLLIYLSTFILSSALTHISMSEKYKSAWVYYSTPISEPGKILSGMFKAIIFTYFVPYCLVLSAIVVAIWGAAAINDIILAFLVSCGYGMLMALFLVKGLPFSKPVTVKQGSGKFITSMFIVVLIGSLGFGHYYLMRWENVIWILIIPFLFINWIMLYHYKKQSWENLEMADDL